MDLATESQELTLLTSGNSYWSGTVIVDVRESHALHMPTATVHNCFIYDYKMNCYYEYCIFIGQRNNLLSGLRLECFFKNIFHTFIVCCAFINYIKSTCVNETRM